MISDTTGVRSACKDSAKGSLGFRRFRVSGLGLRVQGSGVLRLQGYLTGFLLGTLWQPYLSVLC